MAPYYLATAIVAGAVGTLWIVAEDRDTFWVIIRVMAALIVAALGDRKTKVDAGCLP